jgi:hypothetical protein
MKGHKFWIAVVCLLVTLPAGTDPAVAQGPGPNLYLKPAAALPPDGAVSAIVTDPATGRFLPGLTEEDFAATVSGQAVSGLVVTHTQGVAVAVVLDMGGIARGRDPRLGQALQLVDTLVTKLHVDGALDHGDLVGLVPVYAPERENGVPPVPFTAHDPNLLRNSLTLLAQEVERRPTPLYDGIGTAVAWITNNGDAATRERLAHRQPLILVLSDGIDSEYSQETQESILVNQCREHGIQLVTIRLKAPGRPSTSDHLQALATQTGGRYMEFDGRNEAAVHSLYDDVLTQRQAYRFTFPLRRPQGEYSLNLRVHTPAWGSTEGALKVYSLLQPPQANLQIHPGSALTVPYSLPNNAYATLPVTLSLQMVFPDETPRALTSVDYYLDEEWIGSSDTPPDYAFRWDARELHGAGEGPRQAAFRAQAEDGYLLQTVKSDVATVQIAWAPIPQRDQLVGWLFGGGWVYLAVGVLALGLLRLLITVLKMRRRPLDQALTAVTGFITGRTVPLSDEAQEAWGTLEILENGVALGEYPLAGGRIVFTRDDPAYDHQLNEEHVSNPHFMITADPGEGKYYVTDRASLNKTHLNGQALSPHRETPLTPGDAIQVGALTLRFKLYKGTVPLAEIPSPDAAPLPAQA